LTYFTPKRRAAADAAISPRNAGGNRLADYRGTPCSLYYFSLQKSTFFSTAPDGASDHVIADESNEADPAARTYKRMPFGNTAVSPMG
jgi:hypothetical protein